MTVDLGLSGLLHDSASRAPVEGPPVENSEQGGPSERPPVQPEVAYVPLELMAAGKWSELAAWCEQGLSPKLTSSVPDEVWPRIERRVWWIRSQEQLKGVPLSILSAPLEEVGHEFLAHRDSGRGTLGFVIFEALQRELHKLLGELGGRLRSEGDESSATRLEALQKSIGTTHSEPPPSQLAGVNPQGASGVSAAEPTRGALPPPRVRAELTERLTADLTRRELKDATRPPSPQDSGNLSSSQKNKVIASSGHWWFKGLLLSFVILAVLGALLLQRLDIRSLWESFAAWGSGEMRPLASQLPMPDGLKEPALQPPSLSEPQAPSQLEAILEDYRSARVLSPPRDASPRPAGGEVTAVGGIAGPSAPAVSASSAPGHPPAAQVAVRKETINTSGPLEPPHFPRAGESGRDREPPSDSSRGPRAPLPPRAQDAPRPLPERPGFENFSAPRVYRTLVETDVMSAPTIRGRALDVLPAGVEVLVEGKEGYWLRIRSQRGNRGFILSQDAVRVPPP